MKVHSVATEEMEEESSSEKEIVTNKSKPGFSSQIDNARQRYMNSLTMHALDHIINGTRVEKIFWSVKLIAAISFACYFSRDLFASFYSYETNTVTKLESRTQLQFPKVYICNVGVLDSLQRFSNCSSNMSESYNRDFCNQLKSNICNVAGNMSLDSSDIPEDHLQSTSVQGNVSCIPPCVQINRNGDLHQSSTVDAMRHTMYLNLTRFPLMLGITTPENKFFIPSSYFRVIGIDRYGDYHFELERTAVKRLPYPYSNPSCIVQESLEAYEKSLILGHYSVGKCRKSCGIKALLKTCGIINYEMFRLLRKNDFVWSYYKDRNLSAMNQCYREKKNEWTKLHHKCANECRSPCKEVNYKIKEKYKPNKGAPFRVRLFFFYEDLKETVIEYVPRSDVSTLLANFGGQLGVMAGVSAISLIELFIWFLLFVAERINCVYDKFYRQQNAS